MIKVVNVLDAKRRNINLKHTWNGIYYFHDYYPTRYRRISDEDIELRQKIWEYKDMESIEDVMDFTEEMMEAITHIADECKYRNIGLVAVPPSKTYKSSAVRMSIRLLYRWYEMNITKRLYKCNKKMYDFGDLLTRQSNISTSHRGRRATYEEQKESISCSKDNLQKYNMAFIILDDVTTTGTSMDVCRDILIEHGCPENAIYRMAIARTV